MDGTLPPHALSDCRVPVRAGSPEDDLPTPSASLSLVRGIHTHNPSDVYVVLRNSHVQTRPHRRTLFRPFSHCVAHTTQAAYPVPVLLISWVFEGAEDQEGGGRRVQLVEGWKWTVVGIVALRRTEAAGRDGMSGRKGCSWAPRK